MNYSDLRHALIPLAKITLSTLVAGSIVYDIGSSIRANPIQFYNSQEQPIEQIERQPENKLEVITTQPTTQQTEKGR